MLWLAGCENGSGVTCTDGKNGPSQNFLGVKLYNRWYYHKDLFGVTVSGGLHVESVSLSGPIAADRWCNRSLRNLILLAESEGHLRASEGCSSHL